mmetsp:Transcript_29648/g.42057  ORF Transcript_29648/g.42057 Transcript_29648/m.42057 type:complete len:99 (-) Transcript_29648:43-339(-)
MVGATETLFAQLFHHDNDNDGNDNDNDSCWLITQEFGTLPGVLVGRAMILDHMIRTHDPEKTEQGQNLMRDAFYVRTTEWRKKIILKGLRVLFQALDR